MEKTLSIIVPTYNMEKYLRKCLDSLIVSDENMQLLEVLVINDGSKDSSSQIAHEYENKYPQTFRVIDKENGNYGSCINKGLEVATGKYVKVLDADDYYENNLFDLFLQEISKCDVDLIISGFAQVDKYGKKGKIKSFNLIPKTILPFSLFPLDDVLEMHAIAYKLQLIKKLNYHQTEGISYTDNEWSTIPLSRVETIYYFPYTLYQYFVGRDGQTINIDSLVRNRQQFLFVVRNIISKLYNSDTTDDFKSYLSNRILFSTSYIYSAILMGDRCRNQDELIEFDEYLEKSCNPVYVRLGNENADKWLPFKYINKWRKSNRKNIPLLYTALYSILMHLITIKKRLL